MTRRSSIAPTQTEHASAARARQLLDQRFVDAAAECAEAVLSREPTNIDAMLILAQVWRRRRRPSMAEPLLRKCSQLRPNDMAIAQSLAENLFDQGSIADAIELCDAALHRDPNRHEFRYIKAMSLQRMGRHAEAMQAIEPMLRVAKVHCDAIEVAGKSLHGLSKFAESVALMKPFAEDSTQSPSERRKLWLQIARTYDRMDRPDEAMDACRRAHALAPAKFDADRYVQYVDSIIETFSPSNLRALARSTNPTDLPVFIVGMPRSGTTLIEQIIHAHPDGFGVGEYPYLAGLCDRIGQEAGSVYTYPQSLVDLDVGQAERIAADYIARITEFAQQRSPRRIANKALQQHEHVGMLWQILPQARIINIRRNPLDTCLSCYMHELANPCTRNLAHLGVAYQQYLRLMEHWRTTLDMAILDIEYESLVRQTEDVTRRIIDFLGLPSDDRCLRYWEVDRAVMTHSHDQVNKPIYESSIGRWRNYEKHLEPLKQALGL